MSAIKPKIIVLIGPTASGKTSLSLQIADNFDIEIISADSRQIYKYLDIGTAKPSTDELKKVPHHFISIINPDEYYSAGVFAGEATNIINKIIDNGRIPLIVGGSGLYIKALCEGLFVEDFDLGKKAEIKERIKKLKEQEGNEYLFDLLLSVDPEAAELYRDKNPSRIMRALEHYYLTGTKFSSSMIIIQKPNFDFHYIGLMFERETLYDRINLRTEQMWEAGLIDETKKILDMGYSPELNSLNTVGYKECILLINGIIDEKMAIEKIKQHTRNYAKRQMTWFRKMPSVHWLESEKDLLTRAIGLINQLLNE